MGILLLWKSRLTKSLCWHNFTWQGRCRICSALEGCRGAICTVRFWILTYTQYLLIRNAVKTRLVSFLNFPLFLYHFCFLFFELYTVIVSYFSQSFLPSFLKFAYLFSFIRFSFLNSSKVLYSRFLKLF